MWHMCIPTFLAEELTVSIDWFWKLIVFFYTEKIWKLIKNFEMRSKSTCTPVGFACISIKFTSFQAFCVVLGVLIKRSIKGPS